MHHLGQSGVRKDAVDQIRSRGADGHGYDEPLNQFRDFRSDQLCSGATLGLVRTTLIAKMRKLGISRDTADQCDERMAPM